MCFCPATCIARLPTRLFCARWQCTRRTNFVFHSNPAEHTVDLSNIEFHQLATRQTRWQFNLAKARADQSRNRQPLRLEHFAHFAVTPFLDGDVVPLINAFATALVDAIETRRHARLIGFLIGIDIHAGKQILRLHFGKFTQDAYRVFTFYLVTWMHEAICKLAVGGKNEQAGGVDIEPTNRNPLAVFHPRQVVKHGDAVARIAGRHNLALGLVVKQNPRQFFVESQLDRALIDHYIVPRRDLRPGGCDDAVNHHPARRNHDLHVATGAMTRLRQNLMQALALDVGLARECFGELAGFDVVADATEVGNFGR